MMKRLFFYATVLSVAATLAGCSALKEKAAAVVKQPKVEFASFSMGDVSDDGITLIPQFKITNENSFPIPVDGLAYQLSLNGRNIFSGENKAVGTLKSNEPKLLDVPVKLTDETLDYFVNSLLKDKQITYQVAGAVDVMKFDLPFKREGTVFYPEVKMGEFNLTGASLQEVAGAVQVEITNRNDFALPLKSLAYNISSNGRQVFENSLSTNGGIPKQGSKTLTIPIKVKPTDLGASLLSVMSTMKVNFDVDAVVDTGFSKVPLQKNMTVDLRR